MSQCLWPQVQNQGWPNVEFIVKIQSVPYWQMYECHKEQQSAVCVFNHIVAGAKAHATATEGLYASFMRIIKGAPSARYVAAREKKSDCLCPSNIGLRTPL